MILRYQLARWMAITAGAVALAAVLTSCGGPSATTQNVGGADSNQAATAAPTPVTTAPPVPTQATGVVRNLYNVKSFYGQIQFTANTNALQSLAGTTPTPMSSGATGTPPAGSGQVTATLDQWYMQPNKMVLKVTSSSNSKSVGSTLVYDGSTLTFYSAGANLVIRLQDTAQEVLFINLAELEAAPQLQVYQLRQMIENAVSGAQVTRTNGGTVAGQSTTLTTVTPQNSPNIQSIQVWMGDQSDVPLKFEVTGKNGTNLISLEYTTFDTSANINSSTFSFTPPSGATVITPTPDSIAEFAGFMSETLQNAVSRAGFQLYQITSLPSGVSMQSVQYARMGSLAGVAFLYGTGPNDVSTTLIQRPSSLQLPFIRGGQQESAGGQTYTVYQDTNMVVIDWTEGDTALTLATTESRSTAMSMAQSLQPVSAAAAGTPSPGATVGTPSPTPVTGVAMTPTPSPVTGVGMTPTPAMPSGEGVGATPALPSGMGVGATPTPAP